MESIALSIQEDLPRGGALYTLVIHPDRPQVHKVSLSIPYLTGGVFMGSYGEYPLMPKEVIARQLVDKLVADYRERLLKKVLSVI